MPATPTTRRIDLPLVVAWAIFATYVLAARGVRNMFPISVFDMYQAHAPEVVARVLVLDAAGETAQVEQFEGFVCEDDPAVLMHVEDTCGADHRPLEYVTRDQASYLARHSGQAPGPEAITLVSRAYVLTARPGAPPSTDCVLTHCTARRRGSPP
jgi:hypothetical protein